MDVADIAGDDIERFTADSLARRAATAEAARPRVAMFNAETRERVCMDCLEPIPVERIQAAPYAIRCIDCQGIFERRRA